MLEARNDGEVYDSHAKPKTSKILFQGLDIMIFNNYNKTESDHTHEYLK